MKRRFFQLGAAVLSTALLCAALPPIIGVASALGTFIVNSAEVQGNANLFDGAQIKTSKASSQIFLQNGASLVLGIDSAGTIYRDRLVLEQGAAKIDNMSGFAVEAREYRIVSGQPASQVVVRLNGESVEVAALAGSVNVLNTGGALLTRIGSGTATAFQSNGGNGGSGTARPNNNNRIRKDAALYLLLVGALAGLGLGVAAISESTSTSP
ncbi:MAG: hypothetical protein JO270_02805 [Acidobacteriaceae bacterium]|nr:hypothetical protein [Acidobacteriaceae bacterium]MBV8571501.1 hypothetical protein [Acidobacteriaceae bacterium]